MTKSTEFFKQTVTGEGSKQFEVKRANTIVSSVRFNIKTLATVAKFMEMNEQIPGSISEIAKTGLDVLIDVILQQFPMAQFHSETEAFNYIQSLNLLGKSKRNKRRLHGILANDAKIQSQEENPFAKLTQLRVIAREMFRSGQCLDKDQLTLAQLTLHDGQLVENEKLSSITKSKVFVPSKSVTDARNDVEEEVAPMNLPIKEFREKMLRPALASSADEQSREQSEPRSALDVPGLYDDSCTKPGE